VIHIIVLYTAAVADSGREYVRRSHEPWQTDSAHYDRRARSHQVRSMQRLRLRFHAQWSGIKPIFHHADFHGNSPTGKFWWKSRTRTIWKSADLSQRRSNWICALPGLSSVKSPRHSSRHLLYLSHCYSIAWDRLWNHFCHSVTLSVCLYIRPQFWFDFDEILHSDSGPEK